MDHPGKFAPDLTDRSLKEGRSRPGSEYHASHHRLRPTYASVCEISDALRGVFGTYQEPALF